MKKGSPFIIVITALLVLVVVSLLPLSRWTGGRVKDFSLVSDILRNSGLADFIHPEPEQLDPALLEPEEPDPFAAPDSVLSQAVDSIMQAPRPSRVNGMVVIEDYTASGRGLMWLRRAIDTDSAARIAVVGDSWIEGDIFTQDLRNLLQEAYGGSGVGYMSMHSDFPGFRRSVKQGGKGWKIMMAGKKGTDPEWLTLTEQYGIPAGTAEATYEGTKTFGPRTEGWTRSRFIYMAPKGGTISVKTGEGEWEERNIAASDSVRCIEVSGQTGFFGVCTSDPSVAGLGVWLDTPRGISLDCMSSRGFSGVRLARISAPLCRQMARWVDYSLVVLEFGINAMSASQTDYSAYSSKMVDVINHVRRCYPRADILLMGVGDRGEKRGTQVMSMSTADAMISAQRDAARRTQCLFWDTREAMGGPGAIAEWSGSGLVNKDYVHMTHKGGARLAGELFNAIRQSINQSATE